MEGYMNKENKKNSTWEIFRDVVMIILTVGIWFQGYYTYKLNHRIEQKDINLLKGKQLKIVYETKLFVTEYITNFIKYIALEQNKVLTNNPILRLGAEIDTPNITYYRRYYIMFSLLNECLECTPLVRSFEEEDRIDEYFNKKPNLENLEPDVLNPEHAAQYLHLRSLIQQFNDRYNDYSKSIKENDIELIKMLLKMKEPQYWFSPERLINYKRNFVALIEEIKSQEDIFIESFPELKIEKMKFIAEITSEHGFQKVNDNIKGEDYFSHRNAIIKPLKSATIELSDTFYKFDYFNYFVLTTQKSYEKYEHERLQRKDSIKSGLSFSRIIN